MYKLHDNVIQLCITYKRLCNSDMYNSRDNVYNSVLYENIYIYIYIYIYINI